MIKEFGFVPDGGAKFVRENEVPETVLSESCILPKRKSTLILLTRHHFHKVEIDD